MTRQQFRDLVSIVGYNPENDTLNIGVKGSNIIDTDNTSLNTPEEGDRIEYFGGTGVSDSTLNLVDFGIDCLLNRSEAEHSTKVEFNGEKLVISRGAIPFHLLQ